EVRTQRVGVHPCEVGHLTHRFEASKNVSAGIWKKRVGVEKIGTAKHVVHWTRAVVVLAGMRAHPGGDRPELKIFLGLPRLIQRGRMPLPTLVLCERSKRPVHGQTGEQMRGVVQARSFLRESLPTNREKPEDEDDPAVPPQIQLAEKLHQIHSAALLPDCRSFSKTLVKESGRLGVIIPMIRMMRTILAIVVASATFFPAIKEVAAAEPKSLAEVEEFAFGGVGVAGIESQGERFFRAVMDSNDALATFQKILGSGTAAAKLYALCGIRLLSEKDFTAAAQPSVTTFPASFFAVKLRK